MQATLVLDANAFVRTVEGEPDATVWVERIESRQVEAFAPDLIYAEVANALLVQARNGFLDLEAAAGAVDVLRRLPIHSLPLREIAVPALRIADSTGLSAYDACYVAVAVQAEAVLVTADARVAEAAPQSVLLA